MVAIEESGVIFQSTPSGWRETQQRYVHGVAKCISIHSLRVEGDLKTAIRINVKSYFNPLPPGGGRRICYKMPLSILYFNPLPPGGGRLSCASVNGIPPEFQSTPSGWRETCRI